MSSGLSFFDRLLNSPFTKGFYLAVLSYNYPVTLSVLSVSAGLNERILKIQNYFYVDHYYHFDSAFWTYVVYKAHHYGYVFTQVILVPAILATIIYKIINWGEFRFVKIKTKTELKKSSHTKYQRNFANVIRSVSRHLELVKKNNDKIRNIFQVQETRRSDFRNKLSQILTDYDRPVDSKRLSEVFNNIEGFCVKQSDEHILQTTEDYMKAINFYDNLIGKVEFIDPSLIKMKILNKEKKKLEDKILSLEKEMNNFKSNP